MLLKQLNESLLNHRYAFIILDPQTGEFEEYGRGSPIEIIAQIEKDPQNSMIADVIKKQSFGDMKDNSGNLSFKYDDHIYMFVPL